MSPHLIKQLQSIGFLGPMDVQVANLAARIAPETKAEALLAAALASRAISLGHACVNLSHYAGKSWKEVLEDEIPSKRDSEGSDMHEAVDEEFFQKLGNLPAHSDTWLRSLPTMLFGCGTETGKQRTLFVQKRERVYLRRYWNYECLVGRKLKALNTKSDQTVDQAYLSEYFEKDQIAQREAARKAVENRLSLLSGGPGTGKTYTLARAVALLGSLHRGKHTDPVVRMVAPTGKAAIRMVESIIKAKAELAEDLRNRQKSTLHLAAIPEEATTIHRLLGSRYHSPYFKHDASNPIQADLVIVDEASMVDLPLMAKLLDALPRKCALMLVGDTDQLASVEPGRVYGDVCQAAESDGPLAGCLTRLTKSWRFPDDSTIGTISRLVNEGKADEAWHTLQKEHNSQQLQLLDASKLNATNNDFIQWIRQQLQPYVAAQDPQSALAAAGNCRILCALRNGPLGTRAMNQIVEKTLAQMGVAPRMGFYDHQLIMIKVNTPALNLFNGDIGVIMSTKDDKKTFEAWFPNSVTSVKPIPVGLLPEHETAFAMTIHKSQGSEFPNVVLVLPDQPESPILTRELLYTGMTRVAINPVKNTGNLTIWCTEESFKKAATRQTSRSTGLFQ